MTYPTISEADFHEALELFRNGRLDDESIKRLTELKEGGDFNSLVVHELVSGLYQIVEGLGDPKPRGFGARFDRAAAAFVHETLALEPTIASDTSFWRWLSFASDGELAALIDWRYGTGEKYQAPKKYFGLGHPKNSMYGYLWLRANAVFDSEQDDPYEYTRLGDVDLWQSHIIRVDFGSVPQLAKAFVKFIHPGPGKQRISRDDYRSLASELSRRNASVAFELLDSKEAESLINQVWEERKDWLL